MAREMPPPAATLDDVPVPRRTAILTLFGEIVRTEQELATLYGHAAARATIPYLRGVLAQLAEAKRARLPVLHALGAALLGDGQRAAPAPEPAEAVEIPVEPRAEVFRRAFERERALEMAYRELLALLGDPARCPGLAELAATSAQQRTLLRALYLRYS